MKKRLRWIFIAFSCSFVLVAALCFWALRQFSSLDNYSIGVDHTNKTITQLYEIESNLKELDVQELGFMLTRDSAHITKISEVYFRILPATMQLKSLLKGNKQQSRTATLLRAAIFERMMCLKENLENIDTNKHNNNRVFYLRGKKAKEESLAYLSKMRDLENNILQDRLKIKTHYQQITYETVRYLLSFFGLITIFLFIVLIYQLKQRMGYQKDLVKNVGELKRSHNELEQITYALSHNLKEPTRKIQIFSDRLLYVKKDMDDDTTLTLQRIHASANRLNELIQGLSNLTNLIKTEPYALVNLDIVVKAAEDALLDKIIAQNAKLTAGILPTINGYASQLQLLFTSLIENSLKFAKPDTPVHIEITYEKTDGKYVMEENDFDGQQQFHCITIRDNGIGFDNQFSDKMFQIFQRLHNNESAYSGKGIGLAICQRVMANHGGFIRASGKEGIGASFQLFFPL